MSEVSVARMARREMLSMLAEDVVMYHAELKKHGLTEGEIGYLLSQFQGHAYDAITFADKINRSRAENEQQKNADDGVP